MVLKTNFGGLFEWPLKTGFTVHTGYLDNSQSEMYFMSFLLFVYMLMKSHKCAS